MYNYTSDFTSRLKYAVRCIKDRRTSGRDFEGCFMWDDGTQLVHAIRAQAEHDTKLKEAMDQRNPFAEDV